MTHKKWCLTMQQVLERVSSGRYKTLPDAKRALKHVHLTEREKGHIWKAIESHFRLAPQLSLNLQPEAKQPIELPPGLPFYVYYHKVASNPEFASLMHSFLFAALENGVSTEDLLRNLKEAMTNKGMRKTG